MGYSWDTSLETGHEKIDNQHRQLVETLNNLLEAVKNGKDNEEIFNVLEFLTGYTILHFKTEEELQIKYGYPDYHIHKQYHADFKTTVDKLSKRLSEEGPSLELVGEVSTEIGSWLINHIKGDDFRMATFIKSKDLVI